MFKNKNRVIREERKNHFATFGTIVTVFRFCGNEDTYSDYTSVD